MIGGGGGGQAGGGHGDHLVSLTDQGHPQHPHGQHQQGMWQGQLQQHHGFDHQNIQHQQHLQQLHQQQQQQQHQMILGHQSMAPLVGQQISQISSMFPGSGQPPSSSNINMIQLFSGQVQTPPSSNNYVVLGTNHHQRHSGTDTNTMTSSLSPNSTPGIQMPPPAATPPIVNINLDDRNMYLNGIGRLVTPGPGMEKINMESGGQMSEAEQAMIWKGMQGGILAEMFPAVDRFGGMLPTTSPGPAAPGFVNTSAAAAVAAQMQAQENLLRLQQHQQQQQQQQPQKHPQYHPPPPPHMLAHADMTARMFPPSHGFVPPPSPPPSNFVLPPGPRPRPVGGDDTSPGYTPDTSNDNDDLVIGSWNDECEKDNATDFTGGVTLHEPSMDLGPNFQPLSQPPPRRVPVQESAFGGTFSIPRGRGDTFRRGGQDVNRGRGRAGVFRSEGYIRQDEKSFRGGGGNIRIGRGGFAPRSRGTGRGRMVDHADHTIEKAAGKNAAIEETKALLAKMRLEDKEIMDKYKKDKEGNEKDENEGEVNLEHVEPGAYKPRERRGRDDRGRGRGGRGRGMVPQRMPGMFPIPGLPGDFRTPPFPGLEGFLPQQPVYFPPGFNHGMLPGSFPAMFRGPRGVFPRGFPFPVRGIHPALLAARGGRGRGHYHHGGRGRGGYRGGGHNHPQQHTPAPAAAAPIPPPISLDVENEENPLLSAIKSNSAEIERTSPASEQPKNITDENLKEKDEELEN